MRRRDRRRLAGERHSHASVPACRSLSAPTVASASGTPAVPDLVAGKNPDDAPSGGRRPDHWFDTGSAVTAPAPLTGGNLGLQSNYALPGSATLDFSLFKAIPITERFKVQFRAEASTSPIRRSWHSGQQPAECRLRRHQRHASRTRSGMCRWRSAILILGEPQRKPRRELEWRVAHLPH